MNRLIARFRLWALRKLCNGQAYVINTGFIIDGKLSAQFNHINFVDGAWDVSENRKGWIIIKEASPT